MVGAFCQMKLEIFFAHWDINKNTSLAIHNPSPKATALNSRRVIEFYMRRRPRKPFTRVKFLCARPIESGSLHFLLLKFSAPAAVAAAGCRGWVGGEAPASRR